MKLSIDSEYEENEVRTEELPGRIGSPEQKEKSVEESDFHPLKFSDYNISSNIVRALSEMGYESPTSVQSLTIEPALDRRDLIVLSKTGSGKTAAFGVPMVELIGTGKIGRALILAPTRELAVQVEAEIAKIAKYAKLRTVVVYGKHSMATEVEKIDKGLDILVGTPGRVFDHIEHDTFDPREFNLVVLDEADRMLDMGFIDQVDKIIGATAKKRTTYLFSATIPEEIVRLSAKYLHDPHTIELDSDSKTVDEVEQYYYSVHRNEKRTRLYDILCHHNPDSCIVFCNTRFEVDRITDFLVNKGITAKSIHGANSQSMRLKFLNQFKKGDFRVLVATDVAARGLHIEGLELVINYNLPLEKDSYVHRIGRTGRAGKKGLALSLVQEGELYQLYTLEEHAGVMIEELPLPESKRLDRRREQGDLYGIAFRELSKYNPEETDDNPKKGKSKSKKASSKKSAQRSAEAAAPGTERKSDSAKKKQLSEGENVNTTDVQRGSEQRNGEMGKEGVRRKRRRRKPKSALRPQDGRDDHRELGDKNRTSTERISGSASAGVKHSFQKREVNAGENPRRPFEKGERGVVHSQNPSDLPVRDIPIAERRAKGLWGRIKNIFVKK